MFNVNNDIKLWIRILFLKWTVCIREIYKHRWKLNVLNACLENIDIDLYSTFAEYKLAGWVLHDPSWIFWS